MTESKTTDRLAELERILNSEDDTPVEITPDGRVVPAGQPRNEVLQLSQRLRKMAALHPNQGFSGYFIDAANAIDWALGIETPVARNRSCETGSLVPLTPTPIVTSTRTRLKIPPLQTTVKPGSLFGAKRNAD